MSQTNVIMKVRPVNGKTFFIDIQGDVNANAENALVDAYNQATSAGAKDIILNFAQLDYMNSSGIGLLVTLLIRAKRQNQQLLACHLGEHYRQIFELTRLNEAIDIYDTEADVLRAIPIAR
ncbi:MAG: anti-sigma factor antagonist [Chloroflexota bacterium]|nr:MAG: anti-sigma factor antagonist [Chloroflexota bacterium]